MFRVPGAWRSEINESRWLFPLYCLYQELIDVKGNIQTRLFPDSKYGKRHYTEYVHLPVPGTRRLLYPRVDDETIVVYSGVYGCDKREPITCQECSTLDVLL